MSEQRESEVNDEPESVISQSVIASKKFGVGVDHGGKAVHITRFIAYAIQIPRLNDWDQYPGSYTAEDAALVQVDLPDNRRVVVRFDGTTESPEVDALRAERDEAVRLLRGLVNSDDRFRAGDAAAFLASLDKENPT